MSPHRSLFALLLRFAAIAVLLLGLPLRPAAAEDMTPLVSAKWVAAHLHDADLVILDIRSVIDGGGAEAYRRGHIPGALHSDYDKAGWRVTRNGLPFMLPSVPELEKLIGELGIDEDSRVVVVPAGVSATDFGSAARVYWTLRVSGLKRVSILDGGYAAWTADPANPIETRINQPSPKIFTATLDRELLAEAGDVEKAEQSGGATLVDARPAPFFLGKTKVDPAKAYGHIPGAVNIDSASLYDPKTNRLKPADEIAATAAKVPDGPVISYCNTGHWAATDWFVFSQVLGRKNVKLYSGSMVDWTSEPGRPVVSSRTKWDDLKKALGVGQ
jgi:thiosulfate/3-mercaptopyruvate sulfurtransferase